jgi:hypothetical protein
MMRECSGFLVALMLVTSIEAHAFRPPPPLDPITLRMMTLCKGERACMYRQRVGVRRFLARITGPKQPSRQRVQLCLRRSTNEKRVTDWRKAARCV